MIRVSKSATSSRPTGAPETQVSRAEIVLQQAILTLGLPPDSRLVLPMLGRRYGYGPTPLREALSRLTAKGLVEAIDNRGFRVVGMSFEDLQDITKTRVVVETGALRLAMRERAGPWQDHLVAAMHRLSRAANTPPDFAKSEAFEAAHRALHTALIAGCGSRRLIAQQELLYDAAVRYRRNFTSPFEDTPAAIAMHQALVNIVLGTDSAAACAALAAHLELTLHAVYPKGKDTPEPSIPTA
jgi:DNA-binding GntR family transcriptional regulator